MFIILNNTPQIVYQRWAVMLTNVIKQLKKAARTSRLASSKALYMAKWTSDELLQATGLECRP